MSFRDNIGYLLQHTAAAMARQSDEMLQNALGIGYSQFKIMLTLQSNPRVKQRDIAHKLGQTEASISRQIHLMHDDGLLRTVVRPENKREHLTSLTPKGERLAVRAQEILNQHYAPMLNALSDHQKQQFMEALGVLHDAVCLSDNQRSCD